MPEVKLVVDNRESIKGDVLELEDTSLESLDIGDYVFRVDGEVGIVVERKTLADFAASITDGRHREQKSRLLGLYPKSAVLYLIEGDIMSANSALRHSRIKVDTLVSAMLNTMLRDSIQVIRTGSAKETVFMLSCIHKKLKTGCSSPTTHVENLVSASVKLRKQENVTPPMALQMMLACIPGVSVSTAGRISSRFSSMKACVDTLAAMDAAGQIGFIKDIRVGPADNARRISKTAAENVVVFLGLL